MGSPRTWRLVQERPGVRVHTWTQKKLDSELEREIFVSFCLCRPSVQVFGVLRR